MEPIRSTNIFKTIYSAPEMMVYFEKHQLFEVFERLMLELNNARPCHAECFAACNLEDIERCVKQNRTVILTPPLFDSVKLAKKLRKKFSIPSIIYKKKRKPCDMKHILKKLKQFLKHYNLTRKNLIFFNAPYSRADCLEFRRARMDPTAVIEIKPEFQIPFKTGKMFEDECAKFVIHFRQVQFFYREVFKKLNFGPSGDKYVTSLAHSLVQIMKNVNPTMSFGTFKPRVIIYGRKSSGRKTQAKALANKFNLVYVNVEEIFMECLKSPCPLGEALRIGAKTHEYSELLIAAIIYKRVLQKDCIVNGWVIVGYPYNINGFKYMEKFIVPPNKIIILYCRERVAKRRLEKKWLAKDVGGGAKCRINMQYNMSMLNAGYEELEHYNLNKSDILDYLAKKREAIYIDGNHSSTTVKNSIWARIAQRQMNV